ncbi:hypothetical protein Tco_1218241 [Tanacetum coccineum]
MRWTFGLRIKEESCGLGPEEPSSELGFVKKVSNGSFGNALGQAEGADSCLELLRMDFKGGFKPIGCI